MESAPPRSRFKQECDKLFPLNQEFTTDGNQEQHHQCRAERTLRIKKNHQDLTKNKSTTSRTSRKSSPSPTKRQARTPTKRHAQEC